MKRNPKWYKWAVGAGGTIAFAMVLNSVKAEPGFEAAHQQALTDKQVTPENQVQKSDPVFEEWRNERNQPRRRSNNDQYSYQEPGTGRGDTGGFDNQSRIQPRVQNPGMNGGAPRARSKRS